MSSTGSPCGSSPCPTFLTIYSESLHLLPDVSNQMCADSTSFVNSLYPFLERALLTSYPLLVSKFWILYIKLLKE